MPNYKLVVCGLGPAPDIEGIDYIQIRSYGKNNFLIKVLRFFLFFARCYNYLYWSNSYVTEALQLVKHGSSDLVLANDIAALPVAIKIANGKPVLFDAHEYYLGQHVESLRSVFFLKPYLSYLLDSYLKSADIMLTVGDSIAAEYAKRFGVAPIVVTNAPAYCDLKPQKPKKDCIRLVHHGAAAPSRNLESMIKMMEYLDDGFTLDFYLTALNNPYFERLKKLANKDPRISFKKPVPTEQLARVLNAYDIGLYILQPNTLNQEFALPNKFFEFIQARLAIAIGPSIEMVKITKKYDLGIIATDFRAKTMAEALRGISHDQIERWKNNANIAAAQLNAEKNGIVLNQLIAQALS